MDLIETGFIKQVDIPLWIDAYHSFPPLCEGYSDDSDKKRIKEVMVRNIVYNEDRLRIKFYKLYPKYKIVNLDSEKNSEFNEFLQIHSRLIDENYPEDDAFEMALKMAKVPIKWEEIDPTPIPDASGAYKIPSSVINSIKRNKIALKGPLQTPIGKGIRSLNLALRKEFDLYANVRPCKTIPGIVTRFGNNIDLIIIRENTEGEYSGIEFMSGPDIAQSIKVISQKASERIVKFAFDYSLKNSRKKRKADGMFLKSARSVAHEYKDKLKYNEVHVDTISMQLIRHPLNYDVLCMPNLYGDILSDLCSGLIGGLGLTPSANIGQDVSIFEAVHGTAPDIAGQNLANPTALLLSSVMMLRHLKMDTHANNIDKALLKTLSDSKTRTKDLGGSLKCSEFTKAIINNMIVDS